LQRLEAERDASEDRAEAAENSLKALEEENQQLRHKIALQANEIARLKEVLARKGKETDVDGDGSNT
jgi:predicted RNase H-like nuclease (RuvC/YqgF family)